jgi:ABC-type sugar transport system ATPase subunit
MEDLLVVEAVSKRYPGVLAVDRVGFTLRRGEILALLGENGAGKTTLTQMLGGVLRPDRGRIILEGRELSFASAHDAIESGISMVFQQLSMVGSLSVAENIFANRQPVGALDNIRWRRLYRDTTAFLNRFGLELDPRLPVKRLSMGQQQILEILKAISTNPKVLILDEPTSSLTEEETGYLFDNIRRLQKQGMSFIYITHKLSEVFRIADRIMVMRDGRHIGTRSTSEVTEHGLVSMMVGREIADIFGRSASSRFGAEYFRVEGFTRRGAFSNIHFGLRRGEILGLAGLVGAGRTELARSICGIDPREAGKVYLDGTEIRIANPADAIRQRIAYLTEDRTLLGLFLEMSLRDNLIAPSLRAFSSAADFLRRSRIDRFAREKVEEYSIVCSSISGKMRNLSGGNQQKCLIAMWMGIEPRVILFDEPTRGVDVGARQEIYRHLRSFAAQGTGVIVISSDLPELIGICDRILVMHRGRITGELRREEFSEARVLSYAAGLKREAGGR